MEAEIDVAEEVVEDVVEEIEENSEVEEEVQAEPQKKAYKVKVNGVEEEVELSDDDVVAYYQKSKASGQKFQEAERLRVELENKIKSHQDQVKNNPLEYLEGLGVNVDEVASRRVYDKFAYENMTDQERTAYDNANELDRVRAENEYFKQAGEEQALKVKTAEYRDHYLSIIPPALESIGVPNTPKNQAKMAAKMQAALNSGQEVTMQDIARMVKNDYQEDINSLLEETSDDSLREFITDKVMQRINKLSISKLNEIKKQDNDTPRSPKAKKKRKSMTVSEWREMMEGEINNI